jgi:DNA-binding XRE family transcriptional regulator
MAKRGRKPWVPLDLKEVEKYGALGMTQEQIAMALGISHETLFKKKRELSDFADAIKRGKAKGIALIANRLVKQAQDGNVAASIFYLKAQAQWKETHGVEIDFSRLTDNLTDQQLTAVISILDRALAKIT